MLLPIIYRLRSHRTLNFALAVFYSLFILFLHDPVTRAAVALLNQIGLEALNTCVLVAFILFISALLFYLFKQLQQHRENLVAKILWLGITLALLIAHSCFMFDMNLEVIHAFEYSLLALLLFPLCGRFGAAIFFSLPVMLVDECYQYIVLYPEWNDYFDLNDIVMDIYGCALAMSVLMILGAKSKITPLIKRTEFISLISLALLLTVALCTCLITFYSTETCSNTLLALSHLNPEESFWHTHRFRPEVVYHVMKPIEGMWFIGLLLLLFMQMDSRK